MSRRVDALILVMIMAIAPLVPMASAHPSITLSTDVNHVILSPGEATNITLTINNNGSTIETYSISVSGFDSVWEVIPADTNVSGVIPTLSATTDIAIRLSTSALPSNSGTLTITVTEPDANISSSIGVQLSVLPQYLPAIDASSAGDNGLVEMAPGDETNLSILVSNNGNVNDTILLSVGQTPDLVAFWSNWTSGGSNTGSNNSTGNNTEGNSTGGNNTSGNNTGGNSTGGNNTGGNNTGNSTSGIASKSNPAWDIRFLDDTVDLMTPSESRYATLHISIPTDANPGFYGYNLYAASVFGNFSVNSTMVIEVTAVHDLSFTHSINQTLLPGGNVTSTVEIISLSSADGNWTWQTMVDSGDCSAHLDVLETQIMEDDSYEIEILITAGVNTHVNDECLISLHGTLDHDTSVTENYAFTVSIGESWGLSMVLPTSIKLDVDTPETFNVVINNEGSEQDTISLIGIDAEGVTFTNPSPVTLDRGESQYVVMEVLIDSFLVGNITLDFTMSSTNSGSGTVNDSGVFEVKEYAELSMTGPAENRIVIIPGENSSIMLNISNDGTKDLELSATMNGLPNGITVVKGLEDISLEAGNATEVELELVASAGLQPMSDSFTITFDGSWTSTQLTIDLQVADRHEVMIDSSQDRIIASPLGDSSLTLMVTNLGTSTETFVADINNSALNDWFTISVDTLSLNLDSGQSGSITISAREIASGAPISGVDLAITVTSTDDSTVTDSISIAVIPQIADGLITVMSDNDEAKPGEMIYGNVIVTNLGTANDTMRINTVEMDCNLDDAEVVLSPSMSSSPIPWSCTVAEGENSGTKVLTFRLTSAARSDMMVTFSEAYTVEPTWNDEVISFTFDKDELKFDESSEQHTISLQICNEANTFVEGSLDLVGKNEPQMDVVFFRAGETGINSTFSLASKGCQDFKMMLTPINLDGFEASLTVQSISQVLGQTVIDESPELRVDVAGPDLPPQGMDLGLLELNNENSIIALATGWAFALILLMYIRLFRKPAEVLEEEEEEEIPLGPNEVRIDEYNKVTCCSCEARLGVPEGSEPPFRFTCPKCETRIRVVE
ncbi:MAG: hypothetical protein CMB28_06255 [Euryarchaeota archaeon]|nr:hypothetical protein [Euryarchaeota archaeon]